MADEIPISDLPEANTLSGSEIFPLVQEGVTKQVEIDSLGVLFLLLSGGNLTGALTTTSNISFASLQYTTGTISQSGTILSGSGTAFTSEMDGGWLVPAAGSAERFYYIGSGTTAIVGLSQTISPGTTFTLYYFSNSVLLNQDFQSNASIFNNAGFLSFGATNNTSIFLNRGLYAAKRGLIADTNFNNEPNAGPGVTASQSGTTITGSGTSFASNYVGRMIYFATGQSAFITGFTNSTTMTAAVSQTVLPSGFAMGGQNGTNTTCFDGIGNFGTKNAYIYSTFNLPGGTFSVGGNTAFSGAFTFNGTVTANTTVIFPASGTLATTQGMPFTTISGTSQAASVNNGYFANNASLVTITLPSTCAVGDRLTINGQGAGGWLLAQNASQIIHLGSAATTTGTGGSLASTNQWDSITIRCVVSNTTWTTESVVGNITVA